MIETDDEVPIELVWTGVLAASVLNLPLHGNEGLRRHISHVSRRKDCLSAKLRLLSAIQDAIRSGCPGLTPPNNRKAGLPLGAGPLLWVGYDPSFRGYRLTGSPDQGHDVSHGSFFIKHSGMRDRVAFRVSPDFGQETIALATLEDHDWPAR